MPCKFSLEPVQLPSMYSLTLLVKSNIEEKDRKEVLDSVKDKFGKLLKEDLWGVRTLAYPIKHQTQAFYAHFEFEAEPSTIPTLDRSVKLNEDVIRYLLIRTELAKKAPKKIEVKKEAEKSPEVTETAEAMVSAPEEKPKKIKRVIKKL